MSSERIHIMLSRTDDTWRGEIDYAFPRDVDGVEQLIGQTREGSGPADVLETIGQDLDEREIARIRRERGL
jgi:hypothetical protein